MEINNEKVEKCFYCLKQIKDGDMYTTIEDENLLVHRKCYIWYKETDKINTRIMVSFCLVILILGIVVIYNTLI